MGRDAAKASGNVWFEARKRASNWNEKLSSRAGAAELLHVSEDVIADTEKSKYKHMPVATAVDMADLYNAPELLNYYCKYECPIGCNKPLSEEIVSIDRVAVKLLKTMRIDFLEDFKNGLLDIAEDGKITEDELPSLIEITRYLKDLAVTISEIETMTERELKKAGKIEIGLTE